MTDPAAARPLTHSEILQVLSGLLISMFVSNVSGTVVGNALPVITAKLSSTQGEYTWVVTSTLLALTASTPIWGKLADLFDKKKLLLIGIGVFMVGSAAAGAAATTAQLIAFRAIQGAGVGAMMALTQAILGSVIPPLQRGRYMAYTGATIAVATVVGPLVGGFIVDQPWLGWRWCFWSAVPLAGLAMAVLAWKLRVPRYRTGAVTIDWLGAALVTAAVSDLLVWISFVDRNFAYVSWESAAMVGSTVLLIGLFVLVESKATDPIIPLILLRERNTVLAIAASIAVGIGMYGASVFLGQYYQVARGYSPTAAGLMMVPMMFGVMLASIFVGRWVSRVGLWKPFVLVGAVILAVGFGAMASLTLTTPLWLIAVYGAVGGIGMGMTMQNLVLAVQNSVPVQDVGAASATVTFFRSLGGTVGIQVLGSVFAASVGRAASARLAALGIHGDAAAAGGRSQTMDLSALPGPVANAVRGAYGDSIGGVFLVTGVVALVSVAAVALMRSTRLRDSMTMLPDEPAGPAGRPSGSGGTT
ncbi:MAG: MFS transporter [Bifidobacteriaceae bacterium]|jgi:EmrB/QacA subfamily drug resistance transporter|nr:MFS transporter [Bifidobacteriaceae bacterium]